MPGPDTPPRELLLVGNPNVGKSALFARLTGARVLSANYPGTTVGFAAGWMKLDGTQVRVTDVPGTYTLEPTNDAERVARRMLDAATDAVVVNVVDATNLERNLGLTLQLLCRRAPMVIVLNLADEAQHRGITIAAGRLEELLGVPVVATTAVTGEGIHELVRRVADARAGNVPRTGEDRWATVGHIVEAVQRTRHRHHRLRERIGDLTIRPWTGLPIALALLAGSFWVVRFIGEELIRLVLDPLFLKLYLPAVTRLVNAVIPGPVLRALLVGTTPDPLASIGVLSAGLYIPLVVLLPYLAGFYFVLGLLEDTGYLPRLAVLLDSFLHRLGLHGYSAIPVMLGLGCKVPAIVATRVLESRREKIIATALVMMSAPCMAQTAMITSILAPYGIRYLALVFGVLLVVAVASTVLLNRVMRGETPGLIIEIPPYRWPRFGLSARKLWIRLSSFLVDATPFIAAGMLIFGILDVVGAWEAVGRVLGRPMQWLLGLPPGTAVVILTGFLRKDVGIALLAPLHLSAGQLVVASVFLVLYVPCVSTLFVMGRELGVKDTVKLLGLLFAAGLIVAGLLHLAF